VIRELIIRFDYHSSKTVKKLRDFELEKNSITDEQKINKLKEDIEKLQHDYEARLKPVVLEIAFNINSQMERMSPDEIFERYRVRDANSSIIGDCVYKICQRLERPPSHKVILEMMPERFRSA
jgi:hypothetical protein